MFGLFAQAQRNMPGDGPPPEVVGGIILFVFGFICVATLIGLAIKYFFLTTIKNALLKCRKRNRHMEPNQVYLSLIPLFHLYWDFMIVSKVEESLRDEFYDRRLPKRSSYGKDRGQPWALCSVLSIIPYIGGLIALVALVFFIMYWIQMSEIRKELDADDRDQDRDDDPYDDEPGDRR